MLAKTGWGCTTQGRSPGSNIGGKTTELSWEACQARCEATDGCQAILYNNAQGCFALDRPYDGNFEPSTAAQVANFGPGLACRGPVGLDEQKNVKETETVRSRCVSGRVEF